MRAKNLELLQKQLREAMVEIGSGEGEPMEVAILSGLIERFGERDLESAAWRNGPGEEALNESLSLLPLEETEDRIAAMSAEDAQEERMSALLGLDELSAGARWCDAEFLLQPLAARVASLIDGFPETWRDLSGSASVLLASCPPIDGDPVVVVWQSVEASAWHEIPSTETVPVCASAASKLEIPIEVFLSTVRVPAFRATHAQAADALPEAPPWLTVGRGKDWELAITREGEAAVLHLDAPDGTAVSAVYNDAPVELQRLRAGVWRCPAEPGSYVFSIGEEVHEVEVKE